MPADRSESFASALGKVRPTPMTKARFPTARLSANWRRAPRSSSRKTPIAPGSLAVQKDWPRFPAAVLSSAKMPMSSPITTSSPTASATFRAISRVRPRETARRFGRRDQRLGAPEGTKKFKEKDIATIRASAVTSGDQVVAIGYPLHGLLTSDLTVTTGIISSLAGVHNDTRFLQISAPVQPGNSGGPLHDISGNIIGVVTANECAADCQGHGRYPRKYQFCHQDRGTARFSRQRRRALSDRRTCR